MRNAIRSLTILLCLGVAPGLSVVSCTALTGKTAGQNVDDATLTAQVKSKLAAERLASLTRIDVDTERGTVYLNGNVDNAASKTRAEELANQVSGVRKVVNNLQVGVGADR
jgi:hyperosmotically inducible protein